MQPLGIPFLAEQWIFARFDLITIQLLTVRCICARRWNSSEIKYIVCVLICSSYFYLVSFLSYCNSTFFLIHYQCLASLNCQTTARSWTFNEKQMQSDQSEFPFYFVPSQIRLCQKAASFPYRCLNDQPLYCTCYMLRVSCPWGQPISFSGYSTSLSHWIIYFNFN